jgi:spore maturation protein CgeB
MKSKVLIIGPNFLNYNRSIATAFNSDQFEFKIINYAEQYGKICLLNKIRYFVSNRRQKTTARLLSELNNHIFKVYKHYEPEIVLIIKGDTIEPEIVEKMIGSKKILWMMDGIFYNPQSIHLVDKMNAVFLFEKSDVTKVKQINPNTYYLPSAFDDKIFNDLHLKKTIDILFIGTLYPERISFLNRIRHQFPNLKMKVYCERYRFYKNPITWWNSIFDKVFINRFVQHKEANILYNKSKVCLNMHHEQSVYGINPRFFEVIGSNALLFTDHKPFLDDFFSDNKIHVFQSEENLLRLIEEHFNGVQKQTDQKLYTKIRDEHTYRKRVDFILGKI